MNTSIFRFVGLKPDATAALAADLAQAAAHHQ